MAEAERTDGFGGGVPGGAEVVPPKPPRYVGPQIPICWPFLDSVNHAATLDDLVKWVDWLTARFELDHRTIPACWRLHGPLVEELSALYTAWQNAYLDDGAEPLRWMAAFAGARGRLAEWALRSGCRREHNTAIANVP